MTLDLLRFSRTEKALMVIANTGVSCWSIEVVVQAEEMIQKLEDQLGPLKNQGLISTGRVEDLRV